MSNLAQSYGVRRPLEIAAKVAALRAPVAPDLSLVPTVPQPAPVAKINRAQIAAQQAERAALVADLPTLRHYAANSFEESGPTWEEVEALETRLADLNDFLIFEEDAADVRAHELPLAA